MTHHSLALRLAAVILVTLAASACAGGARYASARMPAVAAAPAAAVPPPLDRSYFARDPDGQLSEDALQKILAAPIELDLPARVGVLPIVTATDWRGPGPDLKRVPSGTGAFVKGLRGAETFSLVTDVMPIPSGALGMEALREIAARYRLRYLILYREEVRHRVRVNGVALFYATLVGALFLPGQTLDVSGFLEASVFDVKTGLFLFTVRRSVGALEDSNVWHQGYKLEQLQARLAGKFAPELARDLRADTRRFAEAVRVENEARAAAAPPAPPVPAGPTAVLPE